MTPKEQYQQAVAHIQAKEFQKAKRILERMNHPKADALLAKVNAALAKQPKKKPNRVIFVIGGVVLTVALLLGIITIGSTIYSNMQASQAQARLRAASTFCHREFAVEYIDLEREAFDTACDEEARHAALIYRDEIDFCLSESQNGALTQRLLDCMETEGVIMLGYELRDALEAQQSNMPNSR